MDETLKQTVIVVEDVDDISLNISTALNKRGHLVEHASNAEQAIQMAEANRPAMILTDVDLPTFDQLLKLIRGHDGLKNMIVAIIDIKDPKVKDGSVNVLVDFQALDELIESSQQASNSCVSISSITTSTPY